MAAYLGLAGDTLAGGRGLGCVRVLTSVFCRATSFVPSLFLPRSQLSGFVEAARQRELAEPKASFLTPGA